MKPVAALTALLLIACASTPPTRAQQIAAARESAWRDAALGFTLGLLVMGVLWNFTDDEPPGVGK